MNWHSTRVLKQSLLSVFTLAYAGYTENFHPDDLGLTIHSSEDIVIKVKKKQSYKGDKIKVGYVEFPSKTRWKMITQLPCWFIVLNLNIQSTMCMSWSIGKTVRYLHAALGLPAKSTMRKAICKKILLSWQCITANVVNEFIWNQKRPRRGKYSSKEKDYGEQNQTMHRIIN